MQQQQQENAIDVKDSLENVTFSIDSDDIIFSNRSNRGSINSARYSISHSRSPSIRDDIYLYENRHQDDLRRALSVNYGFKKCKRSSSKRRPSSKYENDHKRRRSNVSLTSNKRPSVISNRSYDRRDSKYSYIIANDSLRSSIYLPTLSKRPSDNLPNSVYLNFNNANEKEPTQRIVWIIIGTFLFILICSILAVVITLTHQSEYIKENETKSQYTFAPDFP